MKKQQLGQLLFDHTAPQQNLSISEIIFDALLKSAKLDIINGYEEFVFWGKIETHEIGFALDQDLKMDVERFGFTINGMWIDLNPTQQQLDKMEAKLLAKRVELLEEAEIEYTGKKCHQCGEESEKLFCSSYCEAEYKEDNERD